MQSRYHAMDAAREPEAYTTLVYEVVPAWVCGLALWLAAFVAIATLL